MQTGVRKIREARAKYLGRTSSEGKAEAKSEYLDALETYFSEHQRGLHNWGYRYVAPSYRPDGILDDMDIALFMSKWRRLEADPANMQKPLRPTTSLKQNIASRKQDISRLVPDLNPNIVSELPGSWRLADKDALLSRIDAGIDMDRAKRVLAVYGFDYSELSPLESEAFRDIVQLEALKAFAFGSSASKGTFREIVDNRGNAIRLYSNARGSGIEATPAEIKTTAAAIEKIRNRVGSDKKPVTISLISPSSILISGHDASKEDSTTLGFAFKGGDANVYVKRHRGNGALSSWYGKDYSPNISHHSTAYSTDEQALEHTVIHEYAHVIMYKYWSTDNNPLDNGSSKLDSDYVKFGVKGQVVSMYGKKNTSEHFAEAYSRYIITGDASPEFLALLESKGLLKSQQID